MIIADRKPLEEILDMIKDCRKILLVGCKGCVTVCNVGGSKEVGILASLLKIARQKEGRPLEIDEKTLERQCDPEYVDQIKDRLTTMMRSFPWPAASDPSFCPRATRDGISSRPSTPPSLAAPSSTASGPSDVPAAGPASFTSSTACAPSPAAPRACSTGPAADRPPANVRSPRKWTASGIMIVRKKMEQGRLAELLEYRPAKDWSTARDGGPRKSVREELVQ